MTIGTPHPACGSERCLLTLEQVAALLQVSKTSVYRLVSRRELAFYRVRGVLRFSPREVQGYLDRARVAPVRETFYGSP